MDDVLIEKSGSHVRAPANAEGYDVTYVHDTADPVSLFMCQPEWFVTVYFDASDRVAG